VHVASNFEVGDAVVKELDAVRRAKAIELVQPARALAQALADMLRCAWI